MIKSLLNAKTPFGGGRPLMTLAAVSLLMLLLAPVATAQDIRYGDSFSATLARRGSGRDVNREFEFYGRDGDEIRVDVTSSGGGVNRLKVYVTRGAYAGGTLLAERTTGSPNSSSNSNSLSVTLGTTGMHRVGVLTEIPESGGRRHIRGTLTLVNSRGCSLSPRLRDGGWAVNVSGFQLFTLTSVDGYGSEEYGLDPDELIQVLSNPICHDGANFYYAALCTDRDVSSCQQGYLPEGRWGEYWLAPSSPPQPPSRNLGGTDGISYGQSVSGWLDDGNYFDDFVFSARSGDVITITMDRTSGDLDPMLRLYNSAARELVQNDDGGSGNNARINRYRISSSGDYFIHALRYRSGQSGRYTLRLMRESGGGSASSSRRSGGIGVDSYCSLADAIRSANRDRSVGGCQAGSGADTLSLTGSVSLRSELPRIESDITIDGNGYRISGRGSSRIFYIESWGRLTINDATLEDGWAADDDELNLVGDGGAILNLGVLRANRVEFRNNVSGEDGGAVRNVGEAHFNNGSFIGNRAERQGGAIYSSSTSSTPPDTASVSISDMEFSDNRSARHAGAVFISGRGSIDASGFINNSAGISGGAVYSLGQLNIARSDFLRNRSNKNGGAIFNDYEAHITIRDSEFSDNSTRTGGGGVFSYGRASATISDSRFTGNSADQGGGVMAKGFARGGRTFYGELSLRNNNFSRNGGGDCYIGEYGDLRVSQGNRFSDGGCWR